MTASAADGRFREHLWPIGFRLAPTARLDLATTIRRVKSATAPPDFRAATCPLASAVASARWTRIRRSWSSAIRLAISSTLWSKAWTRRKLLISATHTSHRKFSAVRTNARRDGISNAGGILFDERRMQTFILARPIQSIAC